MVGTAGEGVGGGGGEGKGQFSVLPTYFSGGRGKVYARSGSSVGSAYAFAE